MNFSNTACSRRLGILRRNSTPEERGPNDDDVEMMFIQMMMFINICWRLKLEGETENTGVCTQERTGVAAEVLMATPCTNSLGGESGGHKHEGCWERSAGSSPY